jgi:hypothetical protein
MTLWQNGAEGGTNGSNVTTTNSGGLSGDAFDSIVYNGTNVTGTGNSNVIYSTAAAHRGALGYRIALASGSSYFRHNPAQAGTRFVMRRSVYVHSDPSADITLMQMNGASTMTQVKINSSGRVYFTVGTSAHSASLSPAGGLDVGWYLIEAAVTLETGGGGNGAIAFRILNNTGSVVHSYTASSQATGTTAPNQVRFGGGTSGAGWTYDYLDLLGFDSLASDWIGYPANMPPEITSISAVQTVAATETVNLAVAATDSDGTITGYDWSFLYPTSGAPSFTGGTTATPSFTAPSAPFLGVIQAEVEDNEGGTDTATTEVRVPLTDDTDADPIPTAGTTVSGTWTRSGGTTDGGVLADGSDDTYITSGTTSSTYQTYRTPRFYPRTAISTGAFKVRIAGDSGATDWIVRAYRGDTAGGAATLIDEWTFTNVTTAQTVTCTLDADARAILNVDPGYVYLEIGVKTAA